MTAIQASALALLALAGATGAWLDLSRRTLPNWLCLAAFAVGIGCTGAIGGIPLAGLALGHSVIALLIGMVLFATGMIGGGDAKFYAGLAAWFPIGQGLFLLVSVGLAGFVLSLAVLAAARRRRRRPQVGLARQADAAFGKVPYGVAIAVGAVGAFWMLALQG